MTSKLKAWLREKTGRDKNVLAEKAYVTTLTPLPATRPNTLTPTNSHDNHGSASSPFFTRLSRELRLAILEEAFGKQNVHMNLLWVDPRDTISMWASNPGRHATAAGYKRPPTRKAVFQWSSSVCHKELPYEYEGQRLTPFWYDPCHRSKSNGGGHEWCDEYPGERPSKCWIGIMGFLLSCRQAYHEAIDVLYSTNTIHIESTLLCANMSQYIPMSHLSRIRSVEMVWEFGPLDKRGNPVQCPEPLTHLPDANFRYLLDRIPKSLPRVTKLSIAVNDRARYWHLPQNGTITEWIETSILRPVDATIQQLSCLQTFELALPGTIYDFWRVRERGESLPESWPRWSEPERMWRQLPSNPETKLSKDLAQGYWIHAGINDLERTLPCWTTRDSG